MIFKHKNYLIDYPTKLDITGDFKPYLWHITNNSTNKKFSFVTQTSGTRISTEKLNSKEILLNDAWKFVKFYLDQGLEKNDFIIKILSTSKIKNMLGSFYTPSVVVDFVADCINSIIANEDKKILRWQSNKSGPHYPSVIDPACGDGIFLKRVLVKGTTKPGYVFGLDIDKKAVKSWKETNLLHEFGGDEEELKKHFFWQNGLDKIHWEQHQDSYKVLKKEDIDNQAFDIVAGNPPYGGSGIEDLEKEINKGLLEELKNYKIWQPEIKKNNSNGKQISWLSTSQSDNQLNILNTKIKTALEKFPIEVLFLEKFIKLAKLPHNNKRGGTITIIIPDGLLSNSTMNYVRQFISSQTKVLGIISLPRGTFKEAKTNAKTSILLLEKTDNQDISQDYPVFLASIPEVKEEYFVTIKQHFTQFMTQQNQTQFIDEANGLMIRTDKTLKDLNTEKPSSRWDAQYWNPKYDYISELANKSVSLKNYLVENKVISADTIRSTHGETYSVKKDIKHPFPYFSVAGIKDTGFDFSKMQYGSKNAYVRLNRSQLKFNDIAIARSGTGSVGKCFIFLKKNMPNIVSDLYIIRVDPKKINTIYILILLKSKFGFDQITRNEKGVSGQTKITNDMIENFTIPLINKTQQDKAESKYLEVNKWHERAMEAKAQGKEGEYRENLAKAQELLKELVAKTEAVIRGERENVD